MGMKELLRVTCDSFTWVSPEKWQDYGQVQKKSEGLKSEVKNWQLNTRTDDINHTGNCSSFFFISPDWKDRQAVNSRLVELISKTDPDSQDWWNRKANLTRLPAYFFPKSLGIPAPRSGVHQFLWFVITPAKGRKVPPLAFQIPRSEVLSHSIDTRMKGQLNRMRPDFLGKAGEQGAFFNNWIFCLID